MQVIVRSELRLLLADEGKHIRDVNDIYVPEHTDSETGELIPEHFPYYSEVIFLGVQVKEDEIDDLYVEEIKEG